MSKKAIMNTRWCSASEPGGRPEALSGHAAAGGRNRGHTKEFDLDREEKLAKVDKYAKLPSSW
jgi:hypothetical protein